MLLSGCPLLEELVMNVCHLDVDEISSDKIKKLALNECILFRQMQISCPGVVSLQSECIDSGGIILKNMSSLVNADLCFDDVELPCFLHTSSNYCPKLLGGISNVTNLRLQSDCYFLRDLLLEETYNCSAFNNLTSLTIGELESREWSLVDWFLQHSPNLKKLTLHFCPPDEDALEEEFCERAFMSA